MGGAALVGILLLYFLTGQYDPFVYPGGMLLLSVCTAVLIGVCVHPGARLVRLLGVAPLRWTGERSYGMYLWQVPVIVLTTPQGAHGNALRDVLQLSAIFALSALSWRYVEQPVRHGALGRLWDRARRRGLARLRPRAPGAAVAGGSPAVSGRPSTKGARSARGPSPHRYRRPAAFATHSFVNAWGVAI